MINLSFQSIRQALDLNPNEAASRLRVSLATYKRWEAFDPRDPLEAWAAIATGAPIEYRTAAGVRAMRKAAGLTQAQAAALVSVKPLAWHRWESGQAAAPAWRLVLFAARLPRAPEPAIWAPPGRDEVRAMRKAAGLTQGQAAALAYLPTAASWEAFERHDMSATMPRHVWELFQFKAGALGRPAPGLPAPGALAAMRKAAGLTQSQAAASVGVKRATWAAWEAGRNPIGRAAWELFLFKAGQV